MTISFSLLKPAGKWPAGFMLFYTALCIKECVVEIAGLVVDEKYRKMGIGRRLLAVTEDWARTQDCTRLSLCSNVKREEAHKFYQALGYQRTKTQYTFTKELTK